MKVRPTLSLCVDIAQKYGICCQLRTSRTQRAISVQEAIKVKVMRLSKVLEDKVIKQTLNEKKLFKDFTTRFQTNNKVGKSEASSR